MVEIVLKCTLNSFFEGKKSYNLPHYFLNNYFQINPQVARYSSSFIKVELGCKDFSRRLWQSPVQAGRELQQYRTSTSFSGTLQGGYSAFSRYGCDGKREKKIGDDWANFLSPSCSWNYYRPESYSTLLENIPRSQRWIQILLNASLAARNGNFELRYICYTMVGWKQCFIL